MAAVYRAYQASVDRYVALKVLPQIHSSDPEFVKRFNQEAQVLAKLIHPYIVPIYDFGEAEGYTYLVMPFIKEGTLAELITGKPFSLSDIEKIITQVGDALDYAHNEHDIIHRDIKPSNVLIGERGDCMLTDFGIAKIMESSVEITRSGTILGTPAYMSPEQGAGQKIDQRSDIYSLGVILYELCTGRVPFKAETPVAVIFKHVHDPLPPPSEYNPEIGVNVERIILKSLAKDPDDRFQAAEEMVEAFQAAVKADEESQSSAHLRPTIIDPILPESDTPSDDEDEDEKIRSKLPVVISIVIVGIVISLFMLDVIQFDLGMFRATETQEEKATEVGETESPEPTEVVFTPTESPTTLVPAFPEPREGEVQYNPIDSAEMIYIPEGCFWMGASKADNPYVEEREGPVHEVCLDGYWIYRKEVNISQFQQFVDATGYRTLAERQGYGMVFSYLGDGKYDWEEVQGANWQFPQGQSSSPAAGLYPVEHIAWEDGVAYCEWARMRLPTEAEWEHAARGPSNSLYPWGNSLPTDHLLNLSDKNCPGMADKTDLDDGYGRSAPTGSYQPNLYDLYDMAGNVWEWVFDWYSPYTSGLKHNPTGPVTGEERIARGGAWDYGEGAARSTYRHRPKYDTSETYGFRCAGTP
jgi:serine/threonine protein kinase